MSGGPQKRKQVLKGAIREVFEMWEADKAFDLPLKLVRSMPRRIEACKLIHGNHTKY